MNHSNVSTGLNAEQCSDTHRLDRESGKEKVTHALSKLLASSYTLYLKTHNFHWNVTGPMFSSLHLLFEQQYSELALAVDLIAERIRALNAFAPGSYGEFSELSSIREASRHTMSAEDMVRELAKDQNTLVDVLHSVRKAADAIGDEPTVDLAIQRMTVHQKSAWMLNASLS